MENNIYTLNKLNTKLNKVFTLKNFVTKILKQ